MWFLWGLAALGGTTIANVGDSILAYRHRAGPVAVMWNYGLWKAAGLLLLFFYIDVNSSWAAPLILTGAVYYGGALLYFLALRTVDASVVTLSLAMQSAIITCLSFLLGERFSPLQAAGIACAISSVLFLIRSLPALRWSECAYILALSAVFVPDVLAKKLAIAAGEPALTVIFWSLLSTTTLSLLVPLSTPGFRGHLLRVVRHIHVSFWGLGALQMLLLFFVLFCTLRAYETGPLALVSAMDNVRPFTIMIFAWCLAAWKPAWAPKESFDRRSVTVKIASFALAFAGLVLLAPR